MKKVTLFLGFALTVMTAAAHADTKILCKGTSRYSHQPFAVEITDNKVTVTGGSLKAPRVFDNLQIANGLITARGLAVSFKNQYGCIRHAVITTEFVEQIDAGYMETAFVDTCSGGSTRDELCLAF